MAPGESAKEPELGRGVLALGVLFANLAMRAASGAPFSWCVFWVE